MRITLFPFGSAGDVFPFLWLARHLRQRGHEVLLVTAPLFLEAAARAGLPARGLGDQAEFDRLIGDPRIWKLFQGTKMVFEVAGQFSGQVAAVVDDLVAQGERPDLMLAPCTVFGARLAREKHGIPLVNVDLQPAILLSAHELPVLFPGMEHLNRLPLWLRQVMLKLPNPADRFAGPGITAACREHGVTPPRRVWDEWGHSPDGTLVLFPDWFCPPKPDWPQPLHQWHFPLEDMAAEMPLSSEVQTFLAAGEKPVVFTPGSANIHAADFFRTALAATTRLGRRAIFVTRDLTQLPHPLPPQVLAVAYAPFSTLVPHASVFVHHGGIGTLSQGFAAGVPQLIMAMAHDQPDNAWRLQRLGAGFGLSVRAFTPDRVATSLKRLVEEPAYAQAAAQLRERMRQRPAATAMMEWLENRRRI